MRHPPAHQPHIPGRRSAGRRIGWWSALLLTAALVAVAGPATAHDALISTDPSDGAVLTEAPAQVVLVFAAPQAGIGAEVTVTGPDGAAWADGPAEASGVTMTQPLATGMPDGAYTVAWRSVAQDGHPVSGTFGFGLDTSATAAPTAEGPAEEAAPADAVTGADGAAGVAPADDPTPVGDVAPVAAEATVVVEATRTPDASGTAGWRWWYTLLLVAAAAGIAGWAAVVRRGRVADG